MAPSPPPSSEARSTFPLDSLSWKGLSHQPLPGRASTSTALTSTELGKVASDSRRSDKPFDRYRNFVYPPGDPPSAKSPLGRSSLTPLISISMSAVEGGPNYGVRRDVARAARDATIPISYRLQMDCFPLPLKVTGILEQSRILSVEEYDIVNLTAVQLRDAIAAKKFSALAVTRAYVKAAAIAQQTTNCLVELFEDEALERAEQLDAHLEREGTVVGPLHGVPVSIKVGVGFGELDR